jgi:LPXTG-motif cell wall-anchored protein
MKVYFQARGRMVAGAVCGIALAAAMTMRADEWDKRTILTVNQPIQVTDKVLEPGQYVFKLLDSSSNRHIVQIFNGDQTHLVDTIMSVPNYRLEPTGSSRFTFWETPPGNARALRAWFYPGDNFGQEFPYPKHPVILEASAVARPAEPRSAAPPEPQVPPQPVPQPIGEQPPAAPEQPVEVAQSKPLEPPAPTPPPAPTASPDVETETPAELPHTASPYPLIGIAGLAALALSGLLRWKRSV